MWHPHYTMEVSTHTLLQHMAAHPPTALRAMGEGLLLMGLLILPVLQLTAAPLPIIEAPLTCLLTTTIQCPPTMKLLLLSTIIILLLLRVTFPLRPLTIHLPRLWPLQPLEES